jgi:hypothetical protein
LRFPVKNDVLDQDTSRRTKVLVSPNYIRFKASRSANRPRCEDTHCIYAKYREVCVGEWDFAKCQKSRSGPENEDPEIAIYLNSLAGLQADDHGHDMHRRRRKFGRNLQRL